QALEIRDSNKLLQLAHSFKGVAATVCAKEIEDCSAKLHQAALEENWERAKSHVKELNLALDRVRNISTDDFL
ncbi:MAG: Hpt domain-containing protein, partial [Deltaproteobacteria bacterium]|nr:Hpt domain-containing protein [Deltaproteobacteria bacterium]